MVPGIVCLKMEVRVDLDQLMNEFESLRNVCLAVECENKKLKNEINLLLAQRHFDEDGRNSLMREVVNLQSVICTQQANLNRIASFEDENKIFTSRIHSLEVELKDLKVKHEREMEENVIKCGQKELELKDKWEKMEIKWRQMVQNEKEKLLKEIEEKMNVIKQLEIKISTIQQENCVKITQMQLQHEGKILKLHDQIARLGTSKNPIGLSNMNDSFRKKLQHLQKDYEAKISHLQERISELENGTVIPESPRRKTTFRKWQA